MAFSTNGTSGGDGLSSEINVTPLIDVLLVMLIIFMVIVPVMPHGLNSVLPSTSPSTVKERCALRSVLILVRDWTWTDRCDRGIPIDGAKWSRSGCCASD